MFDHRGPLGDVPVPVPNLRLHMIRMLGFSLAAVVVASSSAAVTSSIVQVNASSAELLVAGYTQVGTSAFTSYQAGECAVNGCFTLAGTGGTLATKGFFEFQFENFINNPTYYNGLYSIFDVGYGTSGMTRDTLIGLINAQTATTGVTAMLPTQASDALYSSYFSEWLPANLQDSVVLRWQPNPAPQTASGLSAAFVVAWDLTAVNGFGGSQLALDGMYGVPGPGALGLLALGGLLGRRRR